MKKYFNKKSLVIVMFILAFLIILSKVYAVVIDVTANAYDNSVPYGSGTTISWTSSGADYCEYSSSPDTRFSGSGGTTGSFYAGGLTQTTTFTVQCFAPDPAPVCASYYVALSCFIADTKVLLADGTTKNIQDVKIGDVLRGEKTNNKVLGFHQPELDGKLYSFNGGKYFVTEEHPFKTVNGWKSINPSKTEKENIGIKVTKLKVGDTLITEDGYVLLKSIKSKTEKKETKLYNFFLTGDHTYYADGYLVHNKTYCDSSYPCSSSEVCIDAYGSPVPYGDAGSCALCPGGRFTCSTGYTASCAGFATLCTENSPCIAL